MPEVFDIARALTSGR